MLEIDKNWVGWLLHYTRKQTAPDVLIKALVNLGFDAATARYLVAQAASGGRQTAVAEPAHAVVPPYPFNDGGAGYRNDVCPIPQGNRIDAGDRIVGVSVRIERPCVIAFDDLMSGEECAAVIDLARPRLKPSTTIDPATGRSLPSDLRVSEGMNFRRNEVPLLTTLERRIARLLNWPMENGEGFAVLRYGMGDEYRPHFDYFPPQNPGSHLLMERGGQRFSTLIVYLNDVDAGGETHFPDAGISVHPRKGNAVYFQYANAAGHVDPMSLHAGRPVLAGEKWIMTKWSRQRKYGPAESQ